MAWRVLIGYRAASNEYGLFISKPGWDVFTAPPGQYIHFHNGAQLRILTHGLIQLTRVGLGQNGQAIAPYAGSGGVVPFVKASKSALYDNGDQALFADFFVNHSLFNDYIHYYINASQFIVNYGSPPDRTEYISYVIYTEPM